MEIKNKKEIKLTTQEIISIINKYIVDMGLGNSGDKYSMYFIMDNYVFKGVKIDITND